MGSSSSKISPPSTAAKDSQQFIPQNLLSPWMSKQVIPQSLSSSWSSKTQCDANPPAPPPLPPVGADTKAPSNFSASPPPPPPDASADSPPPPSTPQDESIAAAAASASSFPNPGPYENATMEAKGLLNLDTYDGFRCDINKQLSPYMAVVHSFWMGTGMIPDGRNKTYTFVTQVSDEAGFIMARLDPERGSVDGRIYRAVLGGAGMAKMVFNVAAPGGQDAQQGSNDSLQLDLDLGGMTWTSNLKYGCMGGGNVYGCNYFQQVTPRLAMGGEGMYLSANSSLVSNYTLRFTNEAKKAASTDTDAVADVEVAMDKSYMFSGNYIGHQGLLCLNYKRDITPKRVALAAELQCSPASLDSKVLLGAEFNLTRSKVNLVVDGGGKIQSVLEAKLGMTPGSPALTFAAEVDHVTDTLRFGYGLKIGG